jgi:hypothetical protein
VTWTEITAVTLQMRRTQADYWGTMASRRSLIALLCAVFAVLAVPAAASASPFSGARGLFSGQVSAFSTATDCVDPDPAPAGGDPDVTAPDNNTPLAPGGWLTNAYTVTLTGSDSESGLDHLQWCVDGGTATDVPDTTPVTLGSSGVYTFITRAVDVAGNASPWRAETVSIDLSAPNDVTDPGTVNWTTSTRTVMVSALDAVSGVDHVEWQLDSGPIQSGANNTNVSVVADGAHVLHTRAVDVAGNVSVWRDHTIRIDSVDPVDPTAAPGGWQTAAYGVVVSGSDAHSGVASVTYSLDGAAPVTGTSPTTVNLSGDGDHTLTTYVTDNAGNQSTPKTITIRIDTTAPTNQTPAADPGWRGADYAVMVSGADSGSGLRWVEWRVDGGPVTRGVAPLQATVAGNGTHTLETRAIDAAGNASGWRADEVDIDKLKPSNTTPTPAATVANPYTVAITGLDTHSGIASVEWMIDGDPTVYSGPDGSQVTFSTDGAHTLRTQAVDAAGNASGWRTDTFTVDHTLSNDTSPPVDKTPTLPSGWRKNPVTVTLNAADNAGGVGVDYIEVRLDGAQSDYHVGDQVTISDEGLHLFETQVFDLAGNSTQWKAQWVRIDKTQPQDTTAIPTDWSNSNTFTLSGTDPKNGSATPAGIARIEYSIDGAPFVVGADGDTINVGGDGIHSVITRAIDRAENGSPLSEHTFKVDRVVPVNTSAVPSSAWRASALSLALSGSDAGGSNLLGMQWRVDNGDIQDGGPAVVDTDGQHTLETRARDNAGNDSGWRADTVRVDLADPVNTTPEAPEGWRATPYDVTVAGDDGAGSGVATVDIKVDGVTVAGPAVTVTADGEHTIESRITDAVGHTSGWRTDTVRIDSVVPDATLTCTGGTGWNVSVSCTPTADGGPSGIGELTLATDGGAGEPVTSGAPVPVSADGAHTLTLKAVDGAGNEKTITAQVQVDRTAPTPSLSCAAASTPTGYVCHASAVDGLSGLFSLSYSLNGGAWTAVPGNGTFNVASGTVRVAAVDAAGNQALTSVLTLPVRTAPVVTRPVTLVTKSTPVYLAGHHDADGMVGALYAARSASGTVSVDLRPLAVGKGRYQVVITLESGKHKRTVKKTYSIGRHGTLRRMAASLAGASDRTTVTLTVRKQHGRKWRKHATAKVVLAK